jgi:hypothetical protein
LLIAGLLLISRPASHVIESGSHASPNFLVRQKIPESTIQQMHVI